MYKQLDRAAVRSCFQVSQHLATKDAVHVLIVVDFLAALLYLNERLDRFVDTAISSVTDTTEN